MILLWGLLDDTPMQMVFDELKRMNVPFYFLNHRDLDELKVKINFIPKLKGTIEIYGEKISVSDISTCYFRTYNFRDYEEYEALDTTDSHIQQMAAAEDILWSWSEMTDALVINRPSLMASNHSKPYQCSIIGNFGFSIPETLITTSPYELKKFWKRHGQIIYKSISGIRSIVRKLSDEDYVRMKDVQFCPTQFQQFIAGTDYRVHVVGTRTFSCKIHSVAEDYRYSQTEMEIVTLPQAVENNCIELSKHLGFHLSGIDLRCTSKGEWYCFEVNASPAFSYFELKTGLPIANAVARLLKEG
ncbi:MAG TPA: hypothetical protein VE978_25755 [Chitinophagales bacterium]|nr:hypothetical protein [Chitinophagales bacterium]